jgi:TPR repeat protein
MHRLVGVFLAVFLTITVVRSQVQPKPLSNKDVIEMVSTGLSDGVIIEKIRSVKAATFDTSVEGLKSLKAAKVSDAVLKAMINPHGSSPEKQVGQDRQLDDGTADNNLGWAYEHGQGVKQDYQQALTSYRKSAELGNAGGQYNLGWMYQHGLGVTQDYVQAVAWYRKAAGKGLSEAENQLGVLYKDGNGVSRDDRQAVMWFRKATVQGDAQTKLNLGWMYANGRGVLQDYQQALSWYRKAADQGADLQSYLDELPSAVRDQAGQSVSTSNQQSEAVPVVPNIGSASQVPTAASPAPATLQEESQSEAGAITGKIFLITRGGDLKPARLAMVALLDAHAGGYGGRDSAAVFYWNARIENMKALHRQLVDPDDNISCQASLLVFYNSLKSALEWNEKEKRKQIKIGDADEDGAFRFSGILPGNYLILAQGNAGANKAYWEEEVIAESGKEVAIKLPSPAKACLDIP